MLSVGKQAMRAVLHRDVNDESTETALSVTERRPHHRK